MSGLREVHLEYSQYERARLWPTVDPHDSYVPAALATLLLTTQSPDLSLIIGGFVVLEVSAL